MNILILMIPVALLLGGSFVFAFIWATNNGQFDDLDTPAYRILKNDNERKEP